MYVCGVCVYLYKQGSFTFSRKEVRKECEGREEEWQECEGRRNVKGGRQACEERKECEGRKGEM